MICFIYRSPKKDQMYLYIREKDCFDDIPEQLLVAFGEPEFSMVVDLTTREKLSRVDINAVRSNLSTEGYYLQMPPVLDDY